MPLHVYPSQLNLSSISQLLLSQNSLYQTLLKNVNLTLILSMIVFFVGSKKAQRRGR